MSRVVVIDEAGLTPGARIAKAVRRSAPSLLAGPNDAPATSPGVMIVPDLGAFAVGSPTATDPSLVETLIDLLGDHGHTEVVVGAAADESSRWAGNRDVYALVDLLGYSFVTPAGRDYDVVDLSTDLVDAPFAEGGVLAGVGLNGQWVNAGVRVVFAKNATHDSHGFGLGLHTALQVVSPGSMRQSAAGDVIVELLRATPVDLTLIDAIESSHGSAGRRAPKPIRTETIIASDDIWAADTVGALKMGLDPAVSPLFARAPERHDVDIEGTLQVYEGFVAPHPLILDSMAQLAGSPWASQLLRPWLQVLEPDVFPLESPLDVTMNQRLAGAFADPDNDPLAFGALVGFGYLVGAAQRGLDAYRVLYAKDEIARRTVPLGFDPEAFAPETYRAITAELSHLECLLEGSEERRPHLRWRYLDEAVLFDYRRTLPVAFEEFVRMVDVARAISFMNDYLGGVVVELEHDEHGRSTRQAERNLYLPQPNYLVLSGGDAIDVGKLEIVEYGESRHRLYWKTVKSQNGSAIYDDGIVTFDRTETGTAVTIFGRQLFTLPPVWAAVDLGLAPELKDQLVTDAYQTFFDRTVANLEALTEGRDIHIGRSPNHPDGPRPSVALEDLAERALEHLHAFTESIRQPSSVDDTSFEVDELGFTHVRSSSSEKRDDGNERVVADVAAFWLELVDAGIRDLVTSREVWRR